MQRWMIWNFFILLTNLIFTFQSNAMKTNDRLVRESKLPISFTRHCWLQRRINFFIIIVIKKTSVVKKLLPCLETFNFSTTVFSVLFIILYLFLWMFLGMLLRRECQHSQNKLNYLNKFIVIPVCLTLF